MAKLDVVEELGEPTRVRAGGAWVYDNIQASLPGGRTLRQGALVVSFRGHRVSELSLESDAGPPVASTSG